MLISYKINYDELVSLDPHNTPITSASASIPADLKPAVAMLEHLAQQPHLGRLTRMQANKLFHALSIISHPITKIKSTPYKVTFQANAGEKYSIILDNEGGRFVFYKGNALLLHLNANDQPLEKYSTPESIIETMKRIALKNYPPLLRRAFPEINITEVLEKIDHDLLTINGKINDSLGEYEAPIDGIPYDQVISEFTLDEAISSLNQLTSSMLENRSLLGLFNKELTNQSFSALSEIANTLFEARTKIEKKVLDNESCTQALIAYGKNIDKITTLINAMRAYF